MIASARPDLLKVAWAYCVAVMVAAGALWMLSLHPLLEVLVVDLAATVVIFAFSVRHRNSSVYDPYWSVAPPLIALWFVSLDGAAVPARQLLVVVLVWIWGVRLTLNWARGWRGMDHEDWRYRDLRELAGWLWWPLSFAGVHLFPTLVVYLGCLALYPALVTGAAPLGWLDATALVSGAAAVALELRADQELHRFRATRSSRAEVLTRGVWRWCRHPNYLGEIGFWASLFLFGWSAHGGLYPWSWLGPAGMLALFVFVSIPMIERKLRADKPAYLQYQRNTSMLLPMGSRR